MIYTYLIAQFLSLETLHTLKRNISIKDKFPSFKSFQKVLPPNYATMTLAES